MSEFEVPTQLAPTKQSFHSSARPLRQWISQLDALNDGPFSRELYRGLKHANRIELDNKLRLELLESLSVRINQRVLSDQPEYFSASTSQRQTQYQLQLNLLQELGFGYKYLLSESHHARLRFGTKMLTTCTERVISLVQHTALLSARFYQTPPSGLWKDLNTAYRICQAQDIEHNLHPILFSEHDEHSCQQAYLSTAVLLMVQAEALRDNEADALANYLRHAVTECQLVSDPYSDDASGHHSALLHVVDLATEHFPVRCNPHTFKLEQAAEPLWLDLTELCEHLQAQLQKTPELDQAQNSAQPLSASSLRDIINHFSAPRQRRSARGIRNEPVNIQVGLKDIYACLRYPVATDDTRQHGWHVVNYGNHGLGLRSQSGQRNSVQVGELIAIHETSTQRWRVGIVRWVQHALSETRCGIAMIPGKPLPVIAERNHGRGQYEFTHQECLYFNAKDPLHSSLAVPVQCFRFGEKTRLKFSNGQQQQVRLVERLELGGLFSRYQVRADTSMSWIEREVQKRLPEDTAATRSSTQHAQLS